MPFLSLFLAFITVSHLVFTTTSYAETYALKPIIVTAKRWHPHLANITSHSHTITQKDINHHQFHQVLETLQTIPGIMVVQSGGAGGQTTIFSRGTNGNHTQVRLDGMRANDPSSANGSFNFDDLTTDGLETVN